MIGCALDADEGRIQFSRNGQDLGQAFEVPAHLQRQAVYPALCLKNGEVGLNFGGSQLRFQPPPGYQPLDSLPQQCLVSGETDRALGNGPRQCSRLRQGLAAWAGAGEVWSQPHVHCRMSMHNFCAVSAQSPAQAVGAQRQKRPHVWQVWERLAALRLCGRVWAGMPSLALPAGLSSPPDHSHWIGADADR